MRRAKREEKREKRREKKHKKKLREAERKHRASMEKLEKASLNTSATNISSMASIDTNDLKEQQEALYYREMALAKQAEANQYHQATQFVAATNSSTGSPPPMYGQQMAPAVPMAPGQPMMMMAQQPQYAEGDMISLRSDATAPVEDNRHLPRHARPTDEETIAPWYPPAAPDNGFVPVATTSPQIPQQPQMVVGSDGTSMGSGATEINYVAATPAELMAAHTQANGGYNVTEHNRS